MPHPQYPEHGFFPPPVDVPPHVGTRLLHFLLQRKMKLDPWVQGVIEEGLAWKFLERPTLLSGTGWQGGPQATTHLCEVQAKVDNVSCPMGPSRK